MRYVEKLHILMGLPGSGKTTFAEEVKNSPEGKDVFVIHADDVREKYFWSNRYTIRDYIRKGMEGWRGQPNVVVDALILTNDDIFNVLTLFTEYVCAKLEVVIHRWDEDRETCLKNDGGRREKKATGIILNATYEDVDIEMLNKRLVGYGAKGVEVVEIVLHEVKLKPDWYRFFKTRVDFGRDGKLRSERWSIGGEHGSCYGGHRYSEGEEPLEFDVLDQLLDEKCPELKYRDWREIKRKCVTTEETTESEYYGGYTNYMNWVCDLKKIYDLLEDLGYIVENE